MAQLAFSVSQPRPVQTQFPAPVRSATQIKHTESITGGSQAAWETRWGAILGWFFGCSGLLVLNARLSERPPRLRISHVDEKTGLTWTKGLGQGESSAYDTEAGLKNVQIVMDQLPKSRLGINLVHNQVTVSRVVVREAFNAGWRVGDVILEVDGKQVRSNKAVQRAVRRALLQKKLPLNRSGHCRTLLLRLLLASSRSQWALPELICQLQIAVGTAGLHLPAPDRSGHCRTSAASSRSQWALPDFNRELQIPVGTAGLQPRAPDPSGHCRTSTASSRSQWALPGFNRELQIPVGIAGLEPRWALPDLNRDCQIPVGTAGLEPRAPDRSGHSRTSTGTARSQWALPDFNLYTCQKEC
eukprot:s1749_g4.t1